MQFLITRRFAMTLKGLPFLLCVGVLAACTNIGGSSGGGQVQTKGEASQEKANLITAWRNDPRKLGLKPLKPPQTHIPVTDTSKYKKDPPYRIAFASQGPTNSWARLYDASLRYAASHALKDQVSDILYTDANGDASKQVNDIQDLVAQQPDALIVTPLGAAVKAPIERAAAQGIPVVLCTGKVATKDYVTRVDRDNILNGTLMAEWIAKQIGHQGSIIALSGIAGVPTAEDRYAAAKKVFAKYPKIDVLTHQYTNWSPTESKQIMESLLAKYPHLDAIWSDSGINDVGVIQAYREAGKKIPAMSGEPLNGFLRLAKQNKVPFMAVGYPPYHSARCLQAAVQTLEGKPQPRFINVDAAVFTDRQVDQYYQPNCSDDMWVPSQLPAARIREMNLCH
jgi:ribose transport system substrate-binding protein